MLREIATERYTNNWSSIALAKREQSYVLTHAWAKADLADSTVLTWATALGSLVPTIAITTC